MIIDHHRSCEGLLHKAPASCTRLHQPCEADHRSSYSHAESSQEGQKEKAMQQQRPTLKAAGTGPEVAGALKQQQQQQQQELQLVEVEVAKQASEPNEAERAAAGGG